MKRKVKIKKGILLIIIIIIVSIFMIPRNNSHNKKETNKKKLSDTEIKLKKLNNINKKIDYFDMNKIDRYIEYKNNNKHLEITQVIKNVNMNLDKKQYEDIEEAKNQNTELILVNKYYYLKNDYIPNNLEKIDLQYSREGMQLVNYAKDAFEELASNAKKENLNIVAMSSYRSYQYQENLYNNYVSKDGKEAADTYSGRPGHSEHQTGLAVDVYNKKETYTNFEKTDEFNWMQKNAYKYGFILRFPKDKENETGYQYESWHYRYVGKDIAKEIHNKKITLEEYCATHIK